MATTWYLLTEAGDRLTTETGDTLLNEPDQGFSNRFVNTDLLQIPAAGETPTEVWAKQTATNELILWSGFNQSWQAYRAELGFGSVSDLLSSAYSHRLAWTVETEFSAQLGDSTYLDVEAALELPAPPADGYAIIGSCSAYDSSEDSWYAGVITTTPGSETGILVFGDGHMAETVPFVWGPGDIIVGRTTYETASVFAGQLLGQPETKFLFQSAARLLVTPSNVRTYGSFLFASSASMPWTAVPTGSGSFLFVSSASMPWTPTVIDGWDAALQVLAVTDPTPSSPPPPDPDPVDGPYAPDPADFTLFVDPAGNDGNDGLTWGTAKRQIQAAVNISGPGDIIAVNPGAYTQVLMSNSGTLGSRIRIHSTTKHGATVTNPSGPGFDVRGHYVTVDGFEVENCLGNGIVFGGSSPGAEYNQIFNNWVHNVAGQASGGAGIISAGWSSGNPYGHSGSDIFNNIVHDINGDYLTHGIYVSHPDCRVFNNIVFDAGDGWGIHGWHNPQNTKIYSNLVVGTRGIVCGIGDSPGATSNYGYEVYNNIMVGPGTAGLGGLDIRGVGHTPIVTNNALWGTLGSPSGPGSNPIYSDPLFTGTVDPATMTETVDTKLQAGSPLIAAGIPLPPDSLFDYEGVARPATAADVGPNHTGV